MRILLLYLVFFMIIISSRMFAQTNYEMLTQQREEIYRQPLDEVLKTIEQWYNIHLIYNIKNTKDKVVDYAVWRFRTDVKQTLDNVLKPLELVWTEKGKDSFEIRKYEYFRKEIPEGQKQLEAFDKLYTTSAQFESREQQIKECIFKTLGIDPAV